MESSPSEFYQNKGYECSNYYQSPRCIKYGDILWNAMNHRQQSPSVLYKGSHTASYIGYPMFKNGNHRKN